MTEDQARKLEVPIEWNGKANVCVYCGRVPETFYVVTGHDHTDDSIRWCICREAGQYKEEITTLRQRVAELEKERDELKLVVSAHADFFSSTQSEMADLKESVECLSATNDFLIGKRDENIILKAAVKQLTAERDAALAELSGNSELLKAPPLIAALVGCRPTERSSLVAQITS